MNTYTYVEDYLEVIAGEKNPITGKPYGIFETTPPIINLARYDVPIISSMASSTASGIALTDKQAELAVKLILKYKRQLTSANIDISPVEINPNFKLTIRQIDRKKSLSIIDDKIIIKFPYDSKLIDEIRELSKLSRGSWKFEKNSKMWFLSITEPNIIASGGFAKNNNFEISSEFNELYNLIHHAELTTYNIELKKTETNFEIINAPVYLTDYITNNLGGFEFQNESKLLDYSSLLKYSIEENLMNESVYKYSTDICKFFYNKETKIVPPASDEDYETIFNYTTIANRFPLFVYEPDLSEKLKNEFINKYFTDDEVFIVSDSSISINNDDLVGKKIVYFTKYNYKWNCDIPLLLSSAGLLHGGEKSMLLQRSAKIIFIAHDVFKAGGKL